MLCMKCFRDTSAEARRYCVDLDTAYNQGAKKLDRALTVSFKAFLKAANPTGTEDKSLFFSSLVDKGASNLVARWCDPLSRTPGRTPKEHGGREGRYHGHLRQSDRCLKEAIRAPHQRPREVRQRCRQTIIS